MPDPQLIFRIAISLIPVLLFLTILKALDSFKLLKLPVILLSIAVGFVSAGASFLVNRLLLGSLEIDMQYFARYDAPLVEEFFKGLFLFFLIRSNRVGFRVDSAIHGFAIGSGFAVVENVYYLQALDDPNPLLWFIRGFGTAIMHGGVTALFGVIAKTDVDQRSSMHFLAFFPGLAAAMIVHSFFNHVFLPPLLLTLLIMIAIPAILILIFQQSEKSTRSWLDVGFDTDQELLEIVMSDKISASKIGVYLSSLKEKFPPEVVFDVIAYLRVHLELSIKAKGLMLMREAGIEVPPEPETKDMLEELKYLEKSIGPTGKMTISPFLSTKSQDLWQLLMLEKQ